MKTQSITIDPTGNFLEIETVTTEQRGSLEKDVVSVENSVIKRDEAYGYSSSTEAGKHEVRLHFKHRGDISFTDLSFDEAQEWMTKFKYLVVGEL